MAEEPVTEPDRPTPLAEEEPDWLTAESTHPNPNRARRADYQELALPCDACE